MNDPARHLFDTPSSPSTQTRTFRIQGPVWARCALALDAEAPQLRRFFESPVAVHETLASLRAHQRVDAASRLRVSALVFEPSALRIAETTSSSRLEARKELTALRANGLMMHGASFIDMAGRRVMLLDLRGDVDRLIPEVRVFELTENVPLEQLPVRRVLLRQPQVALDANQISSARPWIASVLTRLRPTAGEVDRVTQSYARRITLEGTHTVPASSIVRCLLEVRRLDVEATKPPSRPATEALFVLGDPTDSAGGAYARRL